MKPPIVMVEQVPVQWVDVTTASDFYPKQIPGRFDVELRLVEMPWSLEEAQAHLRNGTRFELVEVSDE